MNQPRPPKPSLRQRIKHVVFVLAVAAVVSFIGYQFPVYFPGLAQRGQNTDRYNAWLQALLYGGSALLILWRSTHWTWLGRGIVWSYLGIASLFLFLIAQDPGWNFFRSLNWFWAERFLLAFGAMVTLVVLVFEESTGIRFKLQGWYLKRRIRRQERRENRGGHSSHQDAL